MPAADIRVELLNIYYLMMSVNESESAVMRSVEALLLEQ